MKVKKMKSANGNPVANQFIIELSNTTVFQSYGTVIAKLEAGYLTLDAKAWDYSRTTAKYRNKFTGLSTEETKQGIKEGTIKLVDLN